MRRGIGIMFVGSGLGAGVMGAAVGAAGMVALGWLGLSLLAVGWAYLGARGAMPHAASLGLFAEGSVAETCSTPGTAAFRRLALDENSGARRHDALHHGLLAHDTRVFGKRSDGTRHFAAALVLLPYLGLLGVVWRLARVTSREPAVTRLREELWLARRLLAKELPAEVGTIVDLTCEQVEPAGIRQRSGYVCFPILDAAAPHLEDLQSAVDRVATAERLLIHCAQGHGRTGLFAAALLLRRGLAQTPQQALAQITAARPGVRLSTVQLRVLHAYADALAVPDAAATGTA